MFVWLHKYEQVSNVAELALASKPLPPTFVAEQSAGPVFKKVSLVEENAPGKWKRALEFTEISDALLLKAERDEAASANSSKRQKVETAAEDEKTHVPTLIEHAALANFMAIVDETTSFEELNDEKDDVTLAERVKAPCERVEGDVTPALSRAECDAEAPEDKERGNKPDASSLASVLEKALQARDNALLKYCLRTRYTKVVARTVARVPIFRVLVLLEVIVRKLERSPNRFARLFPWLRAVLLHHTAYLVALYWI
ncbi:WD repeat-containing protein 43 [Phytophthora ramorum]|nr:WD repeat-containing protein 43 [Phytophthora ramorum]